MSVTKEEGANTLTEDKKPPMPDVPVSDETNKKASADPVDGAASKMADDVEHGRSPYGHSSETAEKSSNGKSGGAFANIALTFLAIAVAVVGLFAWNLFSRLSSEINGMSAQIADLKGQLAAPREADGELIGLEGMLEGVEIAVDNMEGKIDSVSGELDSRMAYMTKGFDTKLSTAVDHVDDKLSTVSDNLDAKITDVSANLNSRVADMSSGLNVQITDVSDGLNAKITNVSNGLNAQITDVSDGLNDKIANVSDGLNTKIIDVSIELGTQLFSVSEKVDGVSGTMMVIGSQVSDMGSELQNQREAVKTTKQSVIMAELNKVLVTLDEAIGVGNDDIAEKAIALRGEVTDVITLLQGGVVEPVSAKEAPAVDSASDDVAEGEKKSVKVVAIEGEPVVSESEENTGGAVSEEAVGDTTSGETGEAQTQSADESAASGEGAEGAGAQENPVVPDEGATQKGAPTEDVVVETL